MPHADSPTCSVGLIQTRAGAGDSADRPALSPACLLLFFFCASPGGPPTHAAGAASSQLPLLLTCHQNRRPERLFGTGLLSRRSFISRPPQTSVSVMVGASLMRGYVHNAAPQALLRVWRQSQVAQSSSAVIQDVVDLLYFKPGHFEEC